MNTGEVGSKWTNAEGYERYDNWRTNTKTVADNISDACNNVSDAVKNHNEELRTALWYGIGGAIGGAILGSKNGLPGAIKGAVEGFATETFKNKIYRVEEY